jgi:hypothetical protein
MIYKPNEQRAKMAQALLLTIVILDGIGMISSYFEYRLIDSWRMGAAVDMGAATSNDLRQRIIAVFQILAFIISAICFIMWFRRAYANLSQKTNLRYSDGWAAGGWFVPILNLWRPVQMMSEMYRVANEVLNSNMPFNPKTLRLGGIGAWWFAWIFNNLLGRISFQMSSKAVTLDEFANASVFDMVATGWSIATALLALKVVRDYASIEASLFNEISNNAETIFDTTTPDQ